MVVIDPTGDWVVHNGRRMRADEAAVRVSHPGFRYGLGLFETILAVDGRGVCVADHLVRMRASAEWLGLRGVPTAAQAARAIASLHEARPAKYGMVRIYLAARSTQGPESDWTVTQEAIAATELRALRRGAKSGISRWVQPTTHPLVAHKTLAYLDRWLTTRDARAAGHFDQIRLDEGGRVAEGSMSSVFAVLRGDLMTHPTAAGVLPGVTSARVLALAANARIPTVERPIHRDELAEVSEVFLTNSTKGVVPVLELDGKPVGNGKPGPATLRLQKLLDQDTRRGLRGGTAGLRTPPRVP